MVFAATPAFFTLLILLAVGLQRYGFFDVLDISTAFLHADVPQEVFVWPPPEYFNKIGAISGRIAWKLKKA
eukprot:9869981-Alexandrium_andersonii.AAC.1